MILERFDTNLEEACEALLAVPHSAWDDHWKLEFGAQAVAWSIDGAHLGLNLRLNDIPIFGTDWPSAGEM